MQTVEQKQSRGRPKGTFSYVKISAAEIAKIAQIQGYLPVSKRFLASIGVDASSFENFTEAAKTKNIKKQSEPIIEVTLEA